MTTPLAEQGNIEASVAYFATFRFDPGSRVLDIGTRFGSFLHRLQETGYDNTVGLDVDPQVLETGRSAYPNLGRRLVHYDGGVLPFADGDFNVVTAFDVIEHIPDVASLLREIRRVLRPNGLFVFQTPNILTNIPKEILYTHSFTAWRTYHCSLQTFGSLRRCLQRAGFIDIAIVKRSICTEFNLKQAKENLGAFGPVLLNALQRLPIRLYPNFWGHARHA